MASVLKLRGTYLRLQMTILSLNQKMNGRKQLLSVDTHTQEKSPSFACINFYFISTIASTWTYMARSKNFILLQKSESMEHRLLWRNGLWFSLCHHPRLSHTLLQEVAESTSFQGSINQVIEYEGDAQLHKYSLGLKMLWSVKRGSNHFIR